MDGSHSYYIRSRLRACRRVFGHTSQCALDPICDPSTVLASLHLRTEFSTSCGSFGNVCCRCDEARVASWTSGTGSDTGSDRCKSGLRDTANSAERGRKLGRSGANTTCFETYDFRAFSVLSTHACQGERRLPAGHNVGKESIH